MTDELLYRTRNGNVCHRKDCEEGDELIPWTFALGRSSEYIVALAPWTTFCEVCKPLEGR